MSKKTIQSGMVNDNENGMTAAQEIRELTCINCPMGCCLRVTVEQGKAIRVAGNTCPKGEAYGRSETEHPVRMITTTLPVINGTLAVVSCKTSHPVDKKQIFDVMRALQSVTVKAPIEIGDVLAANPAGCQADLIATVRVEAADSSR